MDATSAGRAMGERQEKRKAERVADRLGVRLGIGLAVYGHHGTDRWAADGPTNGCGSYDLVLDMTDEVIVCNACGARNLTRVRPEAPSIAGGTKAVDCGGDPQ